MGALFPIIISVMDVLGHPSCLYNLMLYNRGLNAVPSWQYDRNKYKRKEAYRGIESSASGGTTDLQHSQKSWPQETQTSCLYLSAALLSCSTSRAAWAPHNTAGAERANIQAVVRDTDALCIIMRSRYVSQFTCKTKRLGRLNYHLQESCTLFLSALSSR